MSDRTRTFSWQDPELYKKGREMSGLDFLRAIMRQELPTPPFASTLGIVGISAEEGHVVFEMPVAEFHFSPLMMMHGGITATLLDTVLGCAVQSTLKSGGGYTTTDLHIRYVRPIGLESGTLRADGRIVHRGSRTATAEGTVVDARGKPVAFGTAGCLILEP